MPVRNSKGGVGIEDSQGTQFVLGTKAYHATKISVSYGGSTTSTGSSQIDVSTLDLATGSDKVYQSPPLNEVTSSGGTGVIATVSVDFFGVEKPTLNLEMGIDLGAKLAISGKGKVTEYQLDAEVNNVIKGTLKLDITSQDATYTKITPTP
jgi:hypothetical protein